MNNNKTIAIVGCLHGNEEVGSVVIEKLKKLITMSGGAGIIANQLALKRGVRFIDQDLNRSFPGKAGGNYEEKLAFQLNRIVKQYDYVIDFHSFSCQSPPFAILTRRTPGHLKLASELGVTKVVLMSSRLASGKALIDYCRYGISIEAGKHGLKSTNNRAIGSAKRVLISSKARKIKINYYQVVDIIYKKNPDERLLKQIKNFTLVHKGEIVTSNRFGKFIAPYDFYPVLAREEAYPNILCLAAKTVIIKAKKEEND